MNKRRKTIIGVLAGIQVLIAIGGVVGSQIEKRHQAIAREARLERERAYEEQMARCHTDAELPSDRLVCMTPGERAGRRLGRMTTKILSGE